MSQGFCLGLVGVIMSSWGNYMGVFMVVAIKLIPYGWDTLLAAGPRARRAPLTAALTFSQRIQNLRAVHSPKLA